MARTIAVVLATVVLAWAAAAAIVFALYHGRDPIRADAVVVLQGSKTRLPVGMKLVEEGYAPLLVISRGDRRQLENRLCSGRQRIPRVTVLCFDANPSSTRGEAEFVGRLAKRRGANRIDVVTSQFHVFRAGMLMRRCYHGELRMVGAPQQLWKLPLQALSETLKLGYQLVIQRSC
jgi:uncharacterized SAM-binding protein YcdF (DUF218 family)